jgi:two-component system, OmpR family, response regulator
VWTVLLVDDEPSILRGLAALLRGRGYVVLTAQSGNAAVRVAADQHVDLVVIDYHVLDWRGDLVLAAIAAHQPHLSRRCVFITGDLADSVRHVSAAAGCPLLLKPVHFEELEWQLLQLMCDVGAPTQGRGASV